MYTVTNCLLSYCFLGGMCRVITQAVLHMDGFCIVLELALIGEGDLFILWISLFHLTHKKGWLNQDFFYQCGKTLCISAPATPGPKQSMWVFLSELCSLIESFEEEISNLMWGQGHKVNCWEFPEYMPVSG